MFFKTKWLVLLMLIVVLILSLACLVSPKPATVETAAAAPTENPGAVLTQVSQAAATVASGGPIVLEFTEQQLTATANHELESQDQQDIRDLQVKLDDSVVTISGQVTQNGLDLPLTIALSIIVSDDGVPHAQIIDGKVGPFSLPQDILDQFTGQFDQILQDQINSYSNDLFVESIAVDDGRITIAARNRN